MHASEPDDEVAAFTWALLSAGNMLFEFAADLTDALPEDAYPGEDTAEVVVRMMIGAIRTALGERDPQEFDRATELMEEACDRVLEHFRLAVALRQRMKSDGRLYG